MSSSSSRSKSSKPSSTSERPRLMTFRYNSSEVWVKLSDSYQRAIKMAQSEFDELRDVPAHRITFCVKFLESGKLVRISESAWSSMLSKFAERSVIDISLREANDPKGDPSPPQYCNREQAAAGESSTSLSGHKGTQPQSSVARSSSPTSVSSRVTAGGKQEKLHEKLSKFMRR